MDSSSLPRTGESQNPGLGTRLGRYEIRDKLGAGGMGEVYLAHDTQLERVIALKILPAEVARDPQRLIRFLQEARSASKLSHPNVAHIYEIGESGGAHFIAMEYIEGIPLDRKIGGHSLPIVQMLDFASQIADALDEAHTKGITHRDIKSSNIMITPRGQVKVLDFGLAKVAQTAAEQRSGSDSEMATRVKTTPGVVMGTVHYMSPEQALGREVDYRSDIFSFGVVLYEMATGRLPFTGESTTETIDRIAHAQPEAMLRFNYDLPADLEVIVKKALRKDRNERYQSVRDLLVDLKNLRREQEISEQLQYSVPPDRSADHVTRSHSSSGQSIHQSQVGAGSTAEVTAAHQTSSAEYLISGIKQNKLIWIVVAIIAGLSVLGVVAIVAIAFGVYRFQRERKLQTARAPVSANMKISRLTTTGDIINTAISPDGKWLVYVSKEGAEQTLWVRQIATGSTVQLIKPGEGNNFRTTFSPDGNYLYYVATERSNPAGVLYQVPSLGGVARKILTNIATPIAFSPDGRQIAFIRDDTASSGEDQLIVANPDGSAERKLASRKSDKWFNYGGCSWSPNGQTLVCSSGSYAGGAHEGLVAVDVQTGEQKDFGSGRFDDVGRVSWLSDGSGVVVTAADKSSYLTQLWFISTSGEAHRLTNDLSDYAGASLDSTSANLATVQFDETSNVWIAPANDPGRARKLTSGKIDGYRGLAWAADGRIVYTSVAGGNQDLWIMSEDGTGPRQLTNDPTADWGAATTPDGRQVVFTSERGGFPSLWRMDIDGGNLKQLTNNQEDYVPQISPDGRWIIFESWRSGRRCLWKMSIDGGEPSMLLDKFVTWSAFSPDGKTIASMYKDEQPNSPWRLILIPFEGGPPLKTLEMLNVSPDNATVRWSPDGKAITYIARSGNTWNLWSQPLAGGEPKQVTNFTENGVYKYVWSPDGKQIAMTRGTIKSDAVLITNFR